MNFIELKKNLYLYSISNLPLAPSKTVDKMWHIFILFSKDYRVFCNKYFNK